MIKTELIHPGYALRPGEVTEEQFRLLIDISSIRSTKVILALRDYFVLGHSRKLICERNHVNPGYLSIKIREIQALCRRILELYPHLS
ncbi:adhesin biosynthesis transcription regulatory family protein [Edwardsiella tarda]|uniref:PapB/FocB family fimbrial expression transcriptional regulator n=1 Tax=Edwardsiella tarda TaxID=636 RepID=UPI00351BF0C5